MITCSGTIGRMTYVRPDMDGIWSSQDVLKVVPNPECIPPGYLYAFLSSRYGVPLVVSGTYGAIIQHIEPEHIADLCRCRDSTAGFRTGCAIARLNCCCSAQRLRHPSIDARAALLICSEGSGLKGTIVHPSLPDVQWSRPFCETCWIAWMRTYTVWIGWAEPRLKRPAAAFGWAIAGYGSLKPPIAVQAPLGDRHPHFGCSSSAVTSSVFELSPSAEYLVSRSLTPHLEGLLLSNCDVLLPSKRSAWWDHWSSVLPLPRMSVRRMRVSGAAIRCIRSSRRRH